jgi:hypothetical protein
MNTNETTDTAETRQGDLDDLPGTYTIDDGHAGSYDHEATVSVGGEATVTVTCSCGEWEQTGGARFGDEGDTAVLAAWEAHVYEATGRGAAAPKECARRGCTASVMSGSVYCTEVHERWDNPRVKAVA